MAAFSLFQHHHSFPLDSSNFLPNNSSTINVNPDASQPFSIPQIEDPVQNHDQISTKVIQSGPSNNNNSNEAPVVVSVTNTTAMDSPSIITGISLRVNKMDKRRKPKEASSTYSAQSKEKKGKKQKKMKNEDAEKKPIGVKKEAPTGYIHVRARRGQATDSHSLAERVRREKISERMKLLQAIVPGCDKVTGKALMLDEIINYVQSLQNQVEFLSMKLASVNPIYYDFGMDLESFTIRPDQDLNNLASALASMQESSPTTATNYLNSADSLLGQIPNVLPQAGGSRQTPWGEVDELRQKNINQSGVQQQPVFFPLI